MALKCQDRVTVASYVFYCCIIPRRALIHRVVAACGSLGASTVCVYVSPLPVCVFVRDLQMEL